MDIAETVLNIIRNVKKNVVFDTENFDKPLTGKFYKLSARELTYVALEVMYTFNIRLTSEDVMNYRFNTINGIIQIIKHKKSYSLHNNNLCKLYEST